MLRYLHSNGTNGETFSADANFAINPIHSLNSTQFFLLSRPYRQELLRICELPHIGGGEKYAKPLFRQAQRRQVGSKMRAGMMAMAAVVVIGLIWSVAAMSKLVPVQSSEMRSGADIRHVTRLSGD